MSTDFYRYLLRHGDDNLVLSQRLSEYISYAPELEEDLAVANIALDHLGVAMHLLEYAAGVGDNGHSADELAFHRSERDFTNLLLVEQPNADFAHIITRQFFFDAYQVGLWEALIASNDETVAGIAAKASKEAAYHLRHSSSWMIRLGDGTAESHARTQAAIDALWRYVGELFESDTLDEAVSAAGLGVNPASLRAAWEERVDGTLNEATLSRCEDDYQRNGGRRGFHTESLGHLLAEMQWMQRAYPGMQW
ncbi:MAG: 1,2-phenylacetyl-CoA epoxidase subunit PaaC [Actinomycetota bacterium]|nr:1,2-phenylacetyl-CoA epoxidase subunit PaaC [Actinomycetota bacterium]